MKKKIKVGIIFGGRSAEHEVSLQSAKSIVEALDKDKYEPVLIGIDKTGKWHLQDKAQYLINSENPKLIALNKAGRPLTLNPGEKSQALVSKDGIQSAIDVAFPVMHGTYGEDGSIQGLLRMMDIPFVGPDILASSVVMDKDVTKRLLRDANIAIAPFITLNSNDVANFAAIKKQLGLPFFIKPATLGSSVGIAKVKNEKEFRRALPEAFLYSRKVLIEKYIPGREIEVAVLGNEDPKAALPGEVIPNHEFYSYEAKYIDENGARLDAPAKLTKKQVKDVRELAVKIFRLLCLEGMSRIDFFMTKRGKFILNEVNPIPGFTKISMFPRLWVATGLPYPKLLDILIALAIERYNKEKKLKTNF